MAHTCPDCGMLCHCGGDIDDCQMDDTEDQEMCNHCDDGDRISDDDQQETENNREFSRKMKAIPPNNQPTPT